MISLILAKKNSYNKNNYRNAYDKPPPSRVPMAHKTGMGKELFEEDVSGKKDPKRTNPIMLSFA